jgi:nucleoside-diphosphate-sugar epimerase
LPWYTEGATGFVDVRDVTKAMLMLMESEVSSQRFIVSAENESFKNVFTMMAKAFNKRIPGRKVTPLLAAIVWRWETFKSKFTGKKPLITKETSSSAMAIQLFNNDKLKKYFPSFRYMQLPETISYTCSVLQQKVNNR